MPTDPYSQEHYSASAEAAQNRIDQFEAAIAKLGDGCPAAVSCLQHQIPKAQKELVRLRKCATGEGLSFPLESYGLDDNRYFEVRDAEDELVESFPWCYVKDRTMQRFMDRLAEAAQPGRQLTLDAG